QGVLNLTLERISDGLLKALEFDTCNTNIIEGKLLTGQYDSISHDNDNDNDNINHADVDANADDDADDDNDNLQISCQVPLKPFLMPHFKHIHEQHVIFFLTKFIRLLGYYGNIHFLIDFFLLYIGNRD